MPAPADTRAADIRQYLDAVIQLPAGKIAYLIVAVGEPFINADGDYDHRHWREVPFLWPDRREDAITFMVDNAPTHDVFVCPYPMKTTKRNKGNSAWRQIIHADIDNGRLALPEVIDAIDRLGGFAVSSGSPGNGHVYIVLSHSVTPAQHEILCEALRDHLGGDNKISDNDLLRPAGTLNHKSAVA